MSLRVVRGDAALSALVVLGGIASGATALAFLVPAAVAYAIEERWLAGFVAVVGVYLATLVATYFAVALAAASAEVLDGATRPSAAELPSPRSASGRSPAGPSSSPPSTS